MLVVKFSHKRTTSFGVEIRKPLYQQQRNSANEDDPCKKSNRDIDDTYIFTLILSVIGIMYDSRNQDTEIEDALNCRFITMPQRWFDDGVELS